MKLKTRVKRKIVDACFWLLGKLYPGVTISLRDAQGYGLRELIKGVSVVNGPEALRQIAEEIRQYEGAVE